MNMELVHKMDYNRCIKRRYIIASAIVGVFEAMVSIFTFGAYGSNIQLQALLYFSRLEYSRGEE